MGKARILQALCLRYLPGTGRKDRKMRIPGLSINLISSAHCFHEWHFILEIRENFLQWESPKATEMHPIRYERCLSPLLISSRVRGARLRDLVPGFILSTKDRRLAPICPGDLGGGWEKGCPMGNVKPSFSANQAHDRIESGAGGSWGWG